MPGHKNKLQSSMNTSCLCCQLLPACEFGGQYEQHAEQDSTAEQTRSPGHLKQHLPKRLSHPAQHYRLSSASCPIYTPRLLLAMSICLTGAGRKSTMTGDSVNLDWTSMRLVSKVFKRCQTNLSSPRRLFTSATMTRGRESKVLSDGLWTRSRFGINMASSAKVKYTEH